MFCLDNLMASTSGPQTFLAPGTGFVEDNFSTDREGEEGWFGDDSGTLHLLCTLFLSLLHQLNLRSSGIKSWRLGTSALGQAFLLIILHSSILAWRIPRTEESGGYSPWGCKESNPTEHLRHTHIWKINLVRRGLLSPPTRRPSILRNDT